ncbi:hypothetical protein RD792_014474 [Penstemon davidsonii]|uniref:HAT C-terminal dimerisation domain-containing protein n=1 Tax=Penstemon davidsonii TaxID=160366 RepID=A0ABR0CQ41_9LAMI|nr:hypothetical protein RD792_014474 [Penstemon davidsonii]
MEWWKVHTPVYPMLWSLAHHVFAMPISTVASESAFSTGGCVIDDYRASLAPKTAQTLLCGQDWIRQAPIGLLEEAGEAELISNIYKGGDKWLTTINEHVGRQHWLFDAEAGTPEERADVERMRERFKRNRFQFRQSSDLLMRMQVQQ